MTQAPSNESLTTCFTRWREALDRGELLTATFIAGQEPELATALQARINDHFSCSAAVVAETVTHDDTPTCPTTTIHVPGFEFLGLLGKGGMGAVYLVRDSLQRERAMKFVRPDRLTATSKARFFSEALAMAKLEHKNVIAVYDYHEPQSAQDLPFLLMPVYPTSLFKEYDRIRADRRCAVAVLAGIASGVGYLHRQGLLHRDIKPHNVLLTADDVPVVSDFGLVKDLAKVDSASELPASGETYPVVAGQTIVGSVMGTIRYMCPEQAAGQTQLANPTWDV